MDENLNELEALREENERLKEKNDKLYRDCVSFAKKIKAREEEDSRITDLEAEIDSLKAELSRLASTERTNEYSDINIEFDSEEPVEKARSFSIKAVKAVSDDVLLEPIVDNVEEAIIEETEIVEEIEVAPIEVPEIVTSEIVEESTNFFDNIDPEEMVVEQFPAFTDQEVEEEPVIASIPKNHSTYKKSPFRTFIRVMLWIFLIVSLIVGLISSIAYLFSTAFEDYAILGHRFSSVYNNALSPAISTNDVVLIEYKSFDGIELGSPVVTTKDGKSIGTLKGLDEKDGVTVATIKDKHGLYTANAKQFVGVVKLKIPYVGKVVQYACTYQYNYLAIVVSAILVLIALLLIIPSNRSRAPKFGKDYTVEDFTI